MPLYVYECKKGHQTEMMRSIKEHADPIMCDICKRLAVLVIVSCHACPFPSGMWEDIDVNPIEVRSKKQLEKECRSRGIYARNFMENYSPRERLIKYGA